MLQLAGVALFRISRPRLKLAVFFLYANPLTVSQHSVKYFNIIGRLMVLFLFVT